MTSLQATYRPKMTGWRHGNHGAGLSCSWLFENSKGHRRKNPKPVPLFLMSFVWQQASQPQQRMSAQECLLSKSTHKKRGEVGGNPTPGLLSLWPSSSGSERAGRGRQGLAAVVLGLGRAEAGGGQSRGRRHPLFIPPPRLSLFPLLMSTPAPGCGQAPAPARPLLTLPSFPSPHTSLLPTQPMELPRPCRPRGAGGARPPLPPGPAAFAFRSRSARL